MGEGMGFGVEDVVVGTLAHTVESVACRKGDGETCAYIRWQQMSKL
jgi:hypothetical protein